MTVRTGRGCAWISWGHLGRGALAKLLDRVKECTAAGYRPAIMALVVGSTIDRERVSNEHIRAHAYEAHLFRTALARAVQRLDLPCSVTRERDLGGIVAAVLGAEAGAKATEVGRRAGRPWRADEKLATLAAWVALA